MITNIKEIIKHISEKKNEIGSYVLVKNFKKLLKFCLNTKKCTEKKMSEISTEKPRWTQLLELCSGRRKEAKPPPKVSLVALVNKGPWDTTTALTGLEYSLRSA